MSIADTGTATSRAPYAAPEPRVAPLDMPPDEFRALGHALVDRLADFYATLRDRPVTTGAAPREIRRLVGGAGLPAQGTPAAALLAEAAELLCEHSLHNGHPRFWGYITSSAAPLGALGDLLAAAVNPNVGAWTLSPVATEVERQAVRWVCELLGVPATFGGLFVSGGNMANFVGVLAAHRAARGEARGAAGAASTRRAGRLTLHASGDAHTWVHKAADLFGIGLDAVRWTATDARGRMDVDALARALDADRARGDEPFVVVATAGTVGTGAIDPLPEIAALCRERGPWLHVDGAYGALAAALDDRPAALDALGQADSIAVDPHKWLYAPLEAGCAIVRDPHHLTDTFAHTPPYYEFGGEADDPPVNFFEMGPQNSRGFRALKVWLGLRRAGRAGVARMIADDCALARVLHDAVDAHPALEARTQSLSITTFRYVPPDLRDADDAAEYLDALNRTIVERLQAGGEAFVSNAVVNGSYLLRACIVNFRTTRADVEALPAIVARLGGEIDAELRPDASRRDRRSSAD